MTTRATTPSWSFESTHWITADDPRAANRAVFEAVLPFADTVFVCFAPRWLDENLPDTTECEMVYAAVEARFEPVETGLWSDEHPEFRAALPDEKETLQRLASLDGICGRHFVYRFALRKGQHWTYFEIPRDSSASVAAHGDSGNALLTSASKALAPLSACVVPDETRIEWEKNDRRYSVRADSICVSTLDERRTSCLGFTGAESIVVEDDGRRVAVLYPESDGERGFVERLVGMVVDRLVNVPDTFEFDDPETGREFAHIVRETLVAYRPATETS